MQCGILVRVTHAVQNVSECITCSKERLWESYMQCGMMVRDIHTVQNIAECSRCSEECW